MKILIELTEREFTLLKAYLKGFRSLAKVRSAEVYHEVSKLLEKLEKQAEVTQ